MNIKKQAKESRDRLQGGIYVVINPFVRLLIRLHITPNVVTTIGFLGNTAAAAVLVAAVPRSAGEGIQYWMVTLAGALVIGFSLFDMLDGQVARLGNMASTFGAMYDSVLDRYCEILTLGAIAFFFSGSGNFAGALVAFLALMGSVMVSYVRARAEGLGIECKIGFMQRPERVVVTAATLLATGICGQCAVSFDPDWILFGGMALIAVFANITAFARIAHCRRQLLKASK